MQTPAFRWPGWLSRSLPAHPPSNPFPLRAELFSVEQLARHARSLARQHQISTQKSSNRLLSQLDDNEVSLRAFHHSTLALQKGQRLTPAAEWMVDNFYLIEEQIQLARRHLPRGYSRELPRLLNRDSLGLPRVYDIVLELISHVDAQIDAEPLGAFVAAYQRIKTLTMGELWAIPIMLRLGLIENLQRVTTRLALAQADIELARFWVDRLQQMAQTHPAHLVVVVADMARSDLPLSSAFVAEFCQRLAQHSPVLHIARSWLEQQLVEHGLSIEERVHLESQSQAADQVSVSHSIASLRFLSAMDWQAFVEGLSEVEAILVAEPAAVYPEMDFATRDRYRHGVEFLARHSALSETEVAQSVVQLATAACHAWGASDRRSHVGFYLIDAGQPELAQLVRVRWPWYGVAERLVRRFPLSFYVGGIGVSTFLATLLCLVWALSLGLTGWGLLVFGLFGVLGASQLAVTLFNAGIPLLVQPHRLPRLDYSQGIARESVTLVVVPTLLTRAESVAGLLETLELHYLANRDPHLHFALLSDFGDAPAEHQPQDEALLAQARLGIARLNQTYQAEGGPTLFYWLHRPRRWNAAEGAWMGHERKRGKLEDLNDLLCGGSRDDFSEIQGGRDLLQRVRYVITLDSDTQLPRDSARRLIETLAHPLNHAVFDPVSGRITAGYGILQPRVGVSLPSAGRSWFVRLFAGDAGIDPYTREVSDVYQDLFQEGSFIGKGIYAVDAFQRVLAQRFPDNTVLSHDLLEACYVRSALVSDVECYEAYPSRYDVDMARRHRWIRGDWQILPWLFSRVPGPTGRSVANPLSALSRWKIADNLRRSLVPLALLGLILCSWLLLPVGGQLGLILVVVGLVLPGLLAGLGQVFHKPLHETPLRHLRALGRAWLRQLGQSTLSLALLPYEAARNLDAMGRTWVRMLFTHRHLLEWQTSGDVEQRDHKRLSRFYATMWVAPAVALSSGALMLLERPRLFWGALPLLLLWLLAPALAWWLSRTLSSQRPGLSQEQLGFLHQSARRTWYFFETFVTAGENWLPPDNFQEIPVGTIASRTSPTNMGLALLANLAAWDLGYLSSGGLLQRTEDTLDSMLGLERYRGHFYNWYDTRSLKPLLPLYVSSVDSGNLAGHLLTLGAGLRELPDAPLLSPQIWEGLRDTVAVLSEELAQHISEAQRVPVGYAQLVSVFETPPLTGTALGSALTQIVALAAALTADWEELAPIPWARVLQGQAEAALSELALLQPWLLQPDLLVSTSPALQARLLQPWSLRSLAALDTPAELNSAELPALHDGLAAAVAEAQSRLRRLAQRVQEAEELAVMDFAFLYDPARHLFSIGFNASEHRADVSCYDLLASEARLCSYVAIALGQVPQEHWFSMGRLLVAAPGQSLLVSWSGSMFEYLMPMLVMPSYAHTLLDHTCQAAVQQHIAYGQLLGVPWGISESGYNRTDVQLNYQYRAFGVPGLGLKRGLAEDLVVAPYASAMALMVAPRAACENLQRLAAEGRLGAYGFYEAVDYTPARLPPGKTSVTIRSYMAHHQGMSLLALDNLLCDQPMPRRFLACPVLKAAELLLQERVPKTAATVFVEDMAPETVPLLSSEGENTMRVFAHPTPPVPEVNLLSNGRYHVVVSSAGGGYSRWRDLALTRWREDGTRDSWGSFIYLRDLASGDFWSTAYQPTRCLTKGYEAIFTQSRAEFRHRQAGLDVHTEISVSPEDDVELRRVTITNRTAVTRVLELTSYAEVVLTTQAADRAHPAFSNLFVQSEFVPASSALLCTRRARSQEEQPPWLLHLLVGQGPHLGEVSCESDRAKFIGRGGSLAEPAAMRGRSVLSNTVGSVLDPIVSLRRTVTLPPYQSAVLDLVLGASENREGALALVEKYQSARMADRVFDLAWTHGQVTLRHLNASEAEAQLYGRMASALIYADPARRADPHVLRNNRRGQSGLWSYGISGDLPLVLLCISDGQRIELVQQLIQAHAYWRLKGLAVDLMILIEDISVYRQPLHEQVNALIASGLEAHMLDKPGGIFVRRLEQVSSEDRVLLQSAARMVLSDVQDLRKQLEHSRVFQPLVPLLKPTRAASTEVGGPPPHRELLFPNGFGGFTRDGHEYVVRLQAGQSTPAPWVNVLANPDFGTVVSESGGSYTWFENAHEFRLTPWHNDPVQDTSGEAFYLRDEQTGQVWSPTPQPARGATPYVIRHGFGYTVFEHTEHGIVSELWVYVAMDAPVKWMVLKVRNASGRSRRLSVTGYWEWVLGELRSQSLLHVHTEIDLKTGALLARNDYNTAFPERIVFVDVNEPLRTLTGDRKGFMGRNGTLADPEALKGVRLSGKVGAGLDPCGAVQVPFDLADGQTREIRFRLGVGRSLSDVHALIQRCRQADASETALQGVWTYWNQTLGAINVDTPDPAVNVMANGWLLYQTLSSRLWGRTGFYQSGGAFGFRDQLQDVMALVHAEPALTRAHLLRAAAQQFREGDVQHWWHPPAGRGVRTHFSDDFLWLPYVLCRYVRSVGDTGVLNEVIPFLEARALRPDEEAYYDLPSRAEAPGTLYEHAVRAIQNGLRFGAHGLPLMGCGDWNDGMNRVGQGGQGESVWLGFFLYDVLSQFVPLAEAHGDGAFAVICREQALQLQRQLESQAWDGKWYRRAYFDNGEPLGSQHSAECQIDSLPQSWAVLSGAGDPERARQAMAAVDQRLVRRDTGLVQLFDPPFDQTALDPGYIKGYIPGVRENGGQYTHAAVWTAMAFAKQGDSERAWELFNLLNPVHHGGTPRQIAIYKVEPYVVAADIYALAPHTGRGGWTWYTGSAALMYQLLVETLLGVHREGDWLRLAPHLPADWPGFKIHYRFHQTVYHIHVSRETAPPPGERLSRLSLDGLLLPDLRLPLRDDHQPHLVELQLP